MDILVGTAIGFLIGVSAGILMARWQTKRRQQALGEAFLEHINRCVTLAEKIRVLAEGFLDNPTKQAHEKQNLDTFDRALWLAALEHPERLPGKSLRGLIAFYAHLERLNRDVERFARQQQPLLGYPQPRDVETRVRHLTDLAERTRGRAEYLCTHLPISDLNVLPETYPDEQPQSD